MKGEIISVGDEVLAGDIVDSHGPAAARVMLECGVDCRHRQVTGDSLEAIASAVRLAASRADVILLIGGLGPTDDDLTRDGLAQALGLDLVRIPEHEKALRAFARRRGFPWLPALARQAEIPSGGEAIENPAGTALGFWLEHGGCAFAALPGPPQEFSPMLEGEVRRRMRAFSGDETAWRLVKTAGVPESVLEQSIKEIPLPPGVHTAPYAKQGEVHVRVSGPNRADVDTAVECLCEAWGRDVYTTDPGMTLAGQVLELAKSRGLQLASAESCTGGLVSAALTEPSGASDAFQGGVAAYHSAVKTKLLAVPEELIAEHSVYSGQCAEAMAEGARDALEADYAVSTTGVAGSEAIGSAQPGDVWVAAAGPSGSRHRFIRIGDRPRDVIRVRAAAAALDLLRRTLLEDLA
jgi:nicotinamide-nucleotide amidase